MVFMTLELVIFIIVAAVAIFSAAFMLVSRNAVHSALFLVTNFLCVAFFYLMLSAPFLAMIQVTVYAGAIMVLFMFVIMLLGAEKLGGEQGRYRWLAPGAVALTTIFLIIAFVAIVQGNVGLLKPVPRAPEVRFVHAAAGAPAVDIYLNNDRVAHDLTYREPTDFVRARAGQYNALVFPACAEADQTKCPDPVKAGTAPVLAVPVTLNADQTTTFVVAGTPDQLQLLTVPSDLTTLPNEDTFRLTAVNALPGSAPASLVRLDPADEFNRDKEKVIATDLKYGDVAKPAVLTKGDYDLVWRSGDQRLISLGLLNLKAKTSELMILAPEIPAGQTAARPTLIRIEPATRTEEAYGSPQAIGNSMLSTFLLPFELVSLLLLAAMVGAIILTREEVVKRVRQRLVVSPAVSRVKRGITATSVNPSETSAESSAD